MRCGRYDRSKDEDIVQLKKKCNLENKDDKVEELVRREVRNEHIEKSK